MLFHDTKLKGACIVGLQRFEDDRIVTAGDREFPDFEA
jgi:hypothetical protein